MRGLFAPFSVSELEARLVILEAEISERRIEQVRLVNELAKISAHRSDASRTLGEWVQAPHCDPHQRLPHRSGDPTGPKPAHRPKTETGLAAR